MTDRYENIRKVLEMGPTPGPRKWWENEAGYCCVNTCDGGVWIAMCDVRNPFDPEQRANAALIAACDQDTIRALLDERDALRRVLGRILENEASDWKSAEEFGGHERLAEPTCKRSLKVAEPHGPEHISSSDCWCEPELHFKDPETGAEVWVHKELQ